SADGKTVWDADMSGGITWLSNANLAATETFGVSGIAANGMMDWHVAQNWIAAMNTSNYLGYHDWRLPSVTDTGTPGCTYPPTSSSDCGYNITSSEMGHLYYIELGNYPFFNDAYHPKSGLIDDPAIPNDESLFTNFQSSYYWSGTEYAPNTEAAWMFQFDAGDQGFNYSKFSNLYALVVRSGDVATVPRSHHGMATRFRPTRLNRSGAA
ncbi:MAG: DUF1566 domain-containing protein, partial [Candidatus Nitrotoga sp.]